MCEGCESVGSGGSVLGCDIQLAVVWGAGIRWDGDSAGRIKTGKGETYGSLLHWSQRGC